MAAILLLSATALAFYTRKLRRVRSEYGEVRDTLRHILATYSRRLQRYDIAVEAIEHGLAGNTASIRKLRSDSNKNGLRLDRLEKAVSLSLDASRKALSHCTSQGEAFRKLERQVVEKEEDWKKLGRLDEVEKSLSALRARYEAHAAVAVTPTVAAEKGMKVQTVLTGGGEILSHLTPTELQVLTILTGEGAKTSRDIEKALSKTREHTARLMKKLYLEGYVERDAQKLPYVYRVNEKIRSLIGRRA